MPDAMEWPAGKENEGYCFVLLRPETVARKLCGTMINAIEQLDCRIILLQMQTPDKARIAALYDKPELDAWRDEIVDNHMGGPVVALLVAGGKDICQEMGDVVVKLRLSFAVSRKQNGIHSSDSTELALREARIFFPQWQFNLRT